MTPRMAVLVDKKLVGHLWLDDRKQFCFQYERSWIEQSKIPLSLSLPLRDEPYVDDEPHPFFANLLPEQKIREVVARNLGVSPQNDFTLLEKIGGDCAGAVSLYPEGVKLPVRDRAYKKVTTSELKEIMLRLPQRPLLAGEEGIRLSLAGAQKKLPVFFDGSDFHLAYGGAPSNYIIKPPIEGLDNTVENEAYCMALAHEIGLDVPSSSIFKLDDLPVYAIRRYDRAETKNGISRLHQEDFCQALKIPPEFKYESEGGPGLSQCFKLVRDRSIRAGKDVSSLINWVIFNYLIGNSDAHAKNISLLLLPQGPMLAPFYDLLSTRIYAHYGLAERLAMQVGGESDPKAIHRKHWEALAEELNIKPKFLITRILEVAKKLQQIRLKLFKEFLELHKCDALYRLNELICDSCDKTLRKLS